MVDKKIEAAKDRGFVVMSIIVSRTIKLYLSRLFSPTLLVQGERDAMDLLTQKSEHKTVNQRTY